MGRADQTTKIRGMFVHAKQVDAIVKRFPEVAKARLVVSGEMANDTMTLQVEPASATVVSDQGLAMRISEAIRDVTKLRGEVSIVQAGTLPNDGKVIEDARSYQ
jgi:phenylacetate-CoA ligase